MIDYEKFVKNHRPPKEDKKIELSVATAKELIENLSDTGFENRLKELLQEQLDKHEQEIRKIRAKQYCEHEWHIFTKEEIYKLGTPKSWKIEGRDKEYVEGFYLYMFGYCERCEMPYRFNIFTDEDFERIVKEYETEGIITLQAYSSWSNKLFDRLLDKKIGADQET